MASPCIGLSLERCSLTADDRLHGVASVAGAEMQPGPGVDFYRVCGNLIAEHPPHLTQCGRGHRKAARLRLQSRNDDKGGRLTRPPADTADVVVRHEPRIGPDAVRVQAAIDPRR